MHPLKHIFPLALVLATACGPLQDASIVDNLEIDPCAHQTGNVLLPLTEGNYWVYQDSVHRQIAAQPEFLIGADTSTVQIARMLKIELAGEEICIGEKVTSGSADTIIVEYNWNNPDGLHYLEPDSTANEVVWDNTVLASYPAEVGDWWYMGSWKVHFVKTDVEQITPAGTFSCQVYYVSLGTNRYVLHQFFYYAPDVGLVAREAYYIDNAIVYYEYDTRQESDLWYESILLEYNVEQAQ